MEIREAYFEDGPFDDDIDGDFGAILAERLCGTSLPNQIQSAGNMVWVQFRSSDNSTNTHKGFKASFKSGRYHISIGIVCLCSS